MKGHKKIAEEYRKDAEEKALIALSRSNFLAFGHWAATWVHMNKLSRIRQPNPFSDFVDLALSTRKGEIEEKR